ncbi:MAG: hypothetical protein AAGA57_07350 [Planctomycetota bacterium]
MKCNIDAKGKRARLILGIAVFDIGFVLAVLAGFGVLPNWAWWPAIGCFVGGGFAIFEARAGWCALRAMGVKTPI